MKTGSFHFFFCISVFMFFLNAANASGLADHAAALPEKSFVKISDNASLDALTLESSIMYWTNSGVYNPIKKHVRWMGGVTLFDCKGR